MSECIPLSVNIQLLCRLCGTETISQDTLMNIFDTNGVELNIKSKITNCLGFDINKQDNLPKNLCEECVDNLEKFNEFKIKSHKTALYLVNLVTKQIAVNDSIIYPKNIESKQRNSLSSKQIEVNKNSEVSHPTSILHNLLLSNTPSVKKNETHCNICKSNACSCKLKVDSNIITNLLLDSFKTEPEDYDYESSDNLSNENNYASSNIFEPELHIKTDESEIGNVCSNYNVSLPIASNPEACKNMEIIFQCEYCHEGFLSYDISLMHVKLVHMNRKKSPVLCVTNAVDKSIEKTSDKKRVVEKTKVPEIFKCDLCPRECETKSRLKYHMQKHSIATHECTVCNMKFKFDTSLTRHMKLHNKEFDYICNYCGKGMMGKAHFDYHIRTVHTKDYPFHCTKCDKKFPNKGGLKSHNNTVHNDIRKSKCEICNKSFKTKDYLHAHKKVHVPVDERRHFKCNLCDANFVNKNGLKSHILRHTGELKYECSHCDKKYKGKEGLKVHLLTHTGVKDHICEICGKAFALLSNLVSHRRIHTGERPFKCSVCQKAFTQKSSLNVHRKNICSKKKKKKLMYKCH